MLAKVMWRPSVLLFLVFSGLEAAKDSAVQYLGQDRELSSAQTRLSFLCWNPRPKHDSQGPPNGKLTLFIHLRSGALFGMALSRHLVPSRRHHGTRRRGSPHVLVVIRRQKAARTGCLGTLVVPPLKLAVRAPVERDTHVKLGKERKNKSSTVRLRTCGVYRKFFKT